MSIDISTINVLLGLIVVLQTWIIKEMIALKIKVAVIVEHCPRCHQLDDRAEK
jgi:hypothetical protein